MPKNKLTDLRDHLFETIELLKDPDSSMDVKTAPSVTSSDARMGSTGPKTKDRRGEFNIWDRRRESSCVEAEVGMPSNAGT